MTGPPTPRPRRRTAWLAAAGASVVAVAVAVAGAVVAAQPSAGHPPAHPHSTAGTVGGSSSAPRLVSGRPPARAVVLSDGADAQQVVDAHPPGTAFVLAAGTHARFTVVPLSGDRFYARPGAVLDGGGAVASAFVAVSHGRAADGVWVVGSSAAHPLVIEDYGVPGGDQQTAAVQTDSRVGAHGRPPPQGARWRLQWVTVRRSAARGVTLSDAMVVVASTVEDNGRLGIGGGGRGVVVADDTVTGNGVGAGRKGFEAGGIKTVGDGVTIAGDTVSRNGGTGIWTDGDAEGVVVRDDTVTGNLTGIHIEISSAVSVTGDTVTGNAKVGILVTGSSRVTVTGDTVADDGGGILLGGVDRGRGRHGARVLDQVTVTRNRVTDAGTTGLHQALPAGRLVSFDRDTYRDERFVWQGRPVTFAQWQAAGQERHGTAAP